MHNYHLNGLLIIVVCKRIFESLESQVCRVCSNQRLWDSDCWVVSGRRPTRSRFQPCRRPALRPDKSSPLLHLPRPSLSSPNPAATKPGKSNIISRMPDTTQTPRSIPTRPRSVPSPVRIRRDRTCTTRQRMRMQLQAGIPIRHPVLAPSPAADVHPSRFATENVDPSAALAGSLFVCERRGFTAST
jgi:hypothetical protein